MVWNELAPPNITNFNDMMYYINTQSSDAFGIMTILSVFVILMISYRKIDMESIGTSGFICFIISIPLRLIGIVPDAMVVALGVLTIISAMLLFIQRRQYG